MRYLKQLRYEIEQWIESPFVIDSEGDPVLLTLRRVLERIDELEAEAMGE